MPDDVSEGRDQQTTDATYHIRVNGSPSGKRSIRLHGWVIDSCHRPILGSISRQQWEEELSTSYLPEMVFGESSLVLLHEATGIKIHFNAFDALVGWKHEALPPVEVPAAAKWKFRSKPSQQVILDYDYTFTTPYCGSETVVQNRVEVCNEHAWERTCNLSWEESKKGIDLIALAEQETILFYDEVVLYEDELADNGVSLLTVKVRLMPSGWFLLLRFWLRVDGVLMRLRDTRMHCAFSGNQNDVPTILRECSWRESTFHELSEKGFASDSATYSDPSLICQRLPIVKHMIQKLIVIH